VQIIPGSSSRHLCQLQDCQGLTFSRNKGLGHPIKQKISTHWSASQRQNEHDMTSREGMLPNQSQPHDHYKNENIAMVCSPPCCVFLLLSSTLIYRGCWWQLHLLFTEYWDRTVVSVVPELDSLRHDYGCLPFREGISVFWVICVFMLEKHTKPVHERKMCVRCAGQPRVGM
jgi:hypothetical protein